MAGKRRATSELNRDNWDQEDPVEESGIYRKASEDVLKKRVFKTAKRRITRPPEEGTMSAFNPASLVNLTSKSNQPATQLFSFLSEMKHDDAVTNGVSSKPTNQGQAKSDSFSLFTFGNKTDPNSLEKKDNTLFTFGNKIDPSSSENKADNTFNFGNKTNKSDTNSEKKVENTFSFGNRPDKTDTNSLKQKIENNDQKIGTISGYGDNKLNEKVSTTTPTFIFGNTTSPFANQGKKSEELSVGKEKTANNTEHYYAKLKGLNESVSKWINKHVEDNPLINLQPVFKDYEKYFDEIDKEYKKSASSETSKPVGIKETISKPSEVVATRTSLNMFNSSASNEKTISSTSTETLNSAAQLFQFGSADKSASEKKESVASNTFSFGNTSASNTLSTNKTQIPFKFDASPAGQVPKSNIETNSSGFSGFTFNSNPIASNTINFGSIPTSTSAKNEDEEESEEPPKVEVKEVEEEGQIYMIKCKVFVKKDGTFVEKGVGNFFLKPVPDSDKVQVIVRAHNSLANVLCNFILSKSMPTQRMGKNNVMIVCIPTPESKPPPIPVLIKVKSGEDADHLLEMLEKHKK